MPLDKLQVISYNYACTREKLKANRPGIYKRCLAICI